MPRRASRLSLGMSAAACAIALVAAAVPAMGLGDCTDSRCAQLRRIPPPKAPKGAHSQRKQLWRCEPPPGWGWYLRQKFYNDCSQPLVVFDELGDKVWVHQNW
ncbi:MAG: hypothetical protein WAN43_01340 [Rhodomicrobium sp.]